MSSHSDTPQSPILEVFDHLRNTDETPPNNPRIKDWVLQLPSPQFSIYEDQQPEIAAQTRDRPQEPFHILRHLTVTSPNPQRPSRPKRLFKRKAQLPSEACQPRRSTRLRAMDPTPKATKLQSSLHNLKVTDEPEETYQDTERPGPVTRGRNRATTQIPQTPPPTTMGFDFDNFP